MKQKKEEAVSSHSDNRMSRLGLKRLLTTDSALSTSSLANKLPRLPHTQQPCLVRGLHGTSNKNRGWEGTVDGFVGAVGGTPLIRLARLSHETGRNIFGKAEFMK